MLALEDPRWAELSHAYGSAQDVPDLLRRLAGIEGSRTTYKSGDVWDDAWSALCHQDSVYSASYAALPHLVELATQRPPIDQRRFWMLVGAIAGSSDGAPIPPDLDDSYRDALQRADTAILGCLVPGVGESDALWLLVALAGVRGQHELMLMIERLCNADFMPSCPSCGVEVYVTATAVPFVVSETDPARRKPPTSEARRRTSQVSPAPTPSPTFHAMADLAAAAGHPAVAARIAGLDGVVTCPACGERFPLTL